MNREQFHVSHRIGAPIEQTRLAEQSLVCLPPRVAKFTLDEWKLSNLQRCRNTEDQQQLADRILNECQRALDESNERSVLGQSTSEHRMSERMNDIEFNRNELNLKRKEICTELEALGMYKVRLQDCLANLQSNALSVCRKCLMLRDGRLGIDLVVDSVETALQAEINTIIGGQNVLTKVLEQVNEQVRRLRATRYLVDNDLHYKQAAIDIDKSNLAMKPTDTCLSIYEGFAPLDPANISADEYNDYSANNIRNAAKEVASGRSIRMYVDTLLKQVIDDLWTAYSKCNHEFSERIKDTRIAKTKLEEMHFKTTEMIADMQNTIIKLEKALADKEGHIGLAHTRMGRRAQRVGGELVKDPAGLCLMSECQMLRMSVEQLQQALFEASSSLRYLLQTQLQLEEDINIKMNTLKIDEVDCMVLRKTVDYHYY